MAYKVLGQATTTAASATVINNLIKDSSFEASQGAGSPTNPASANIIYQPSTLSNWKVANGATNASLLIGTGNYGTYAWGWNLQGGQHGYIGQGFATGTNVTSTFSSSTIDTTTAIPVTAGTTYYCGFDYYQDGTTNGTAYYKIAWFNGTTYLSTSGPINGSVISANTWRRNTSNVTAPASATYAIVYIQMTGNAGYNYYIDGIVFGTDNSYNTTYTEPILPNTALLTSPFDKKTNGYLTQTLNTNTGITYAGALTTLYTVPSGKSSVVSTLTIANLISTATTYRVAVVPSGETLAAKHFIFMDVSLSGNSTQTITIGMTLAAGDVVKVAADTSTVSATLFGSES